MKKRVHVFYIGRVQGVGFRMSAEDAARPFDVVGWVKNLADGRVEVVAEGDERTLKKFLDALRTGAMKNFIQDVDASWADATGEFREFEIRYF